MENRMKIEFAAVAENEAFARTVAAGFVMPVDPTVEELTEIKTAVSEAVSNSVIHAYAKCTGTGNCGESQNNASNRCEEPETPVIEMECVLHDGGKLVITVRDFGVGIENVEQARQPLFTTGNEDERSGMGFTVMESFMDRLSVQSEKGKGTTVVMTKQLDIVSGS